MTDPASTSALLSALRLNEPAADGAIRDAVGRLGHDLPADYAAFLAASDGGYGILGDDGIYIDLWPSSDLGTLYADEVAISAPGFTIIGSDGGGEALGFVRDADGVEYVMVPFLPLDLAERITCGRSFAEFLAHLAEPAAG